jgi:hypothetical protein
MLPLNPPLSLSPLDQQRIRRYIANLNSHLCSAQVPGQRQRSVHHVAFCLGGGVQCFGVMNLCKIVVAEHHDPAPFFVYI